MQFGPTESNDAVANGVVPAGATDFTRVEARPSEGSDVLRAISKEVDIGRSDVDLFPAIPLHDAFHSLGKIP